MKNTVLYQSVKIAGLYFAFGVTWILISDRVVNYFISNASYITRIQTFKGWAFIFFTASFLFILLYRQFGVINSSKKSFEIRNIELNQTLEKLSEREKVLNKTIDEKNIFLKETHHRVKNNLQIISSLVNLQMNYITENEIKNIFLASQQRIKAIALIHEKLYQSDNLSIINFKDYIDSLILDIRYVISLQNISIENSSDNILINMDAAVPCGLIINELIVNAVKHAFDDSGGTIKVSVTRRSDLVVLSVEDDGISYPHMDSFQDSFGLGLSLVDNLVKQINGTITFENGNGMKIHVEFPLPHIDS